MKSQRIAVLGAGAWGTALAIHLAKVGHSVNLWTYRAEQALQMQASRQNVTYLKDIVFPSGLNVTADFGEALKDADAVLVVVPSHVFRETLTELAKHTLTPNCHIAWATKGFEISSGQLLHQVAQQVLGKDAPIAVLSGPTFAVEVAKGLPTAMVSAAFEESEALYWAQAFQNERFRMYTQSDMTGVEVGGAYKNIMAIATGLSDGLHLGANARAALISRGLVEMMRFGQAMGAQTETLMGLAGLGDLVLTCTDDLSRNRRFGLNLARPGQNTDSVIAQIGQVVEGVKAARAVKQIALAKGLDLPIMMQVLAIIEGEIAPADAVKQLMSRDAKAETDF
ncbi:NAD(P)H-dependent glycerol-3-phosphate dehydrogenase [Thiosulfativibrio zosterae]|uniref:Glycerol-3-phosphate dehydrogenase [NAD(P)+] n=1 Tax=Thiosulfativibrio zosterae TaxID=2675053 RepID=A0A6F8PK73_9GAMM|nr:NAD(P)H-dependent glycerol-3-phosphate dehydrogenase [Thiosulfativibrio zosterae]BBP42499.1 glycerol-3-phosphate dehydrogenase [NAD(P)+] [Thiosulfativibrio zosterae]